MKMMLNILIILVKKTKIKKFKMKKVNNKFKNKIKNQKMIIKNKIK